MPYDGTAFLTNKTIQKLEKMHQLLDRGWCQGIFTKSKGTEHCILGAAQKVGFMPSRVSKERKDKEIEFAELLGFGGNAREIIDYNDTPGRHKDEVLNLIQLVIDREREKLLA